MILCKRMALIFLIVLVVSCCSNMHSTQQVFLNGETLCVDDVNIVSKSIYKDFLYERVSSIKVRLANDVGVGFADISSDPSFNSGFFNDIKEFVGKNRKNVDYYGGGLYKVNISYRPIAEVNSMRLIDLLLPGDGKQWFYVEDKLLKSDVGFDSIYFVMCWDWAEQNKGVFCERRIPYKGVTVSYDVIDKSSKKWKEIDDAVQSNLRKTVTNCR